MLPRVELSKDDLSDFEIIDLVLKDDDEKDELEKRNIKGSTNNLADFDDECLAEKIEQVTLKADTEEEKSLPDYLAEHAEQQQQQLADKQDKQTEKLLKLSNDATHGALVKVNNFCNIKNSFLFIWIFMGVCFFSMFFWEN